MSAPHTEYLPIKVSLGYWFKLGWISFGGPAGQIALLHDELVTRQKWISQSRFLHALNFCMILPGPEAQQLATYMGWLMHGRWGGFLAGVLFILPSLFILMVLSWVYLVYGHTLLLTGIFYGIKPAVVAIVVHAGFRIGSKTLTSPILWAIAIASLIATQYGISFPYIIACAMLIGFLLHHFLPNVLKNSASHGEQQPENEAVALINNQTPTPKHAQFSMIKTVSIVAVGVVLWALPIGVLTACFGFNDPLVQICLFFTQASLLTFGGAYAVLPYVYAGVVNQHHWLTPTQMMDGLALGETTPGPLIMIVTFVGFVAGYQGLMLGEGNALSAGILAGLLVTWFTFLPSFIFIFAGAPLVESTRQMPKLSTPLTVMSASIVGVIFNLALFFISHVIWKNEATQTLDYTAIALMMGSMIALFYLKWSVLRVIGVAGLIGCLVTFFDYFN